MNSDATDLILTVDGVVSTPTAEGKAYVTGSHKMRVKSASVVPTDSFTKS